MIVRVSGNVLHYCGVKCILEKGSVGAPPLIISCEHVTRVEILYIVHPTSDR